MNNLCLELNVLLTKIIYYIPETKLIQIRLIHCTILINVYLIDIRLLYIVYCQL